MPASTPRCGIKTIPTRLHTNDRGTIPVLDRRDRLFIRHIALPEGSSYGFQIPGHDHLEDQSANSEKLNKPDGRACDVLFDSKNGNHHWDFQIACIDLSRVDELTIPNEKTILRGQNGAIIHEADIYTFEVLHHPTPCIYPHCVIQAKKNGEPPKRVSSGIKTTIRMKFAEFAESNRQEMTLRQAKEIPEWSRELQKAFQKANRKLTMKRAVLFIARPFTWLRKFFGTR